MGFKIATAFVSVTPDDTGFQDALRRQVQDGTRGVDAKVGLRLGDDAPIFLNEDVLAAVDLATENVRARVGLGLERDAVEVLDADVKAATDTVEQDAKVKVKVDEKSAKDTQQGISGLIVGAIAGGAAIGAPALVTAVSAALDAITVKALATNKVIGADLAQVGHDAEGALEQAVAPLAPAVHEALGQVDAEIGRLQPDLDSLFANVNPDIQQFADGVDQLASGLLPGLSKALGNSHDLVADVAASMGTLGTGVGNFFTGLSQNAATTGRGLQAVIGTASTALGTLGQIAGSASTVISTDLLAVTPAVNLALEAIDKLASPATVGAAGGAFAAWKLGGPIGKGLDSASNKLLDVAARAEGAGGMFGKLSGAAAGSSMGLSKMADVMGGPWGIAIGAGVGLLSGLVGSLISAGDATKAVTVSAQDLQNAVAQDGGAAGQATAAYITAADAANGLAGSASAAGVSQATWTEAVLGNKDAQDLVTDSIMNLNQAQQDQALAAAKAGSANSRASVDMKGAQVSTAQYAAQTNQLTDANQKLLNSLRAQQQQVADAISAQTKYEQAMAAVSNQQQLFNASLQAADQQMVANAQAAALTTVGTLNLGSENYVTASSLDTLVTSYGEAQAGGNAYAQVLAALNGQTQSLLGSEAAFTTSLNGVSAAAKANGHSLDVNTASGAANITAFTGMASAADKAATAVYQSEVNTKGASQAYNDANAKLQQEKQSFEDAAIKAGYSKDQVKALADQLYQLPPDVPVGVGVDTSSAQAGLSALIRKINTSHGTVNVYENSEGDVFSSEGGFKAHAAGGYAPYTEPAIFGEEGPEIGYPVPGGMQIIPAAQTRQILSGARPAAAHPKLGGSVTVHQTFIGSSLPSIEQRATMRRELGSLVGV